MASDDEFLMWDDYIGQRTLKSRLEIAMHAALADDRMLDHILMVAPPGTGKTTLANLIAFEMAQNIETIKGRIKVEQFYNLIEEQVDDTVIFLDEIHNLSPAFQELLQPALSEGVLFTPEGWEIDTSRLTFVGATVPEYRTKILEPLRDRFETQPTWEPYTDEELAQIMAGMAKRMGFEVPDGVIDGLAGACRGTPRHGRKFMKAARDLSAAGMEVTVESVLGHIGVDGDGLSTEHLAFLRHLRDQGGTVGADNLANLMNSTPTAIKRIERDLAASGCIRWTSRGRQLTPTGREKIGVVRRRKDRVRV